MTQRFKYLSATVLMTALVALSPFALFAQDGSAEGEPVAPAHETYTWEAEPKLYQPGEDDADYGSVVVKDARITEFRRDNSAQGAVILETRHFWVHLNSDESVEQFNKVYIPVRDEANLIDLKARAIAPDGTVTEIGKEKIKELENVEDYGNLKLLAIEGAVKGGDVEYIYTVKTGFQLFGRENIQREVPIKELRVST